MNLDLDILEVPTRCQQGMVRNQLEQWNSGKLTYSGWEASWADVITQIDYVKEERKWLWEAQQLGIREKIQRTREAKPNPE